MNGTSMGSDNLNMKMLKPLDEVMRCPICSEFFNNCVMTSCCHDFCSVCIKRRMTTESDCPICYEDLREGDLRKNDSMDKIVRIYKKLTRLNAGRPSESQTQSTDQSQKSSCNSSGTLDDSQVQNTPSVESSSERMVPFQNRPRTQSTPLIHTIQPILSELTTPIKIEIDDCDDAEEDINVVSTSNRTSSSINFAEAKKMMVISSTYNSSNKGGRGQKRKCVRETSSDEEDVFPPPPAANVLPLGNQDGINLVPIPFSSLQVPENYSWVSREDFEAFKIECFRLLNEIIQNQESTLEMIKDIKRGLGTPTREPLPEGAPEMPLKCYNEVVKLEQWLLCKNNKSSLLNYLALIGGKNLEKSTRNIMGHIFSKDLATIFNWAGRGEKMAFSTLLIKDVVVRAALYYSTKEQANSISRVEDAIKTWLKSAKSRLSIHNVQT